MATGTCARCGAERDLPWRCIVCGAPLCGRCDEQDCGKHGEQAEDLPGRRGADELEELQRPGAGPPVPPRGRPN